MLAACLAAAAAGAHAQAYPMRAIRLVVAASPGGGTDLTARRMAPRLAPVSVRAEASSSKTSNDGAL